MMLSVTKEIWIASTLDLDFEHELGNVLRSYMPLDISTGMHRDNFHLESSEPYTIGGDGIFGIYPIHLIFVFLGTYVLAEFAKSFASEMGKTLANKISGTLKKKAGEESQKIKEYNTHTSNLQIQGVSIKLLITFKLEEENRSVSVDLKLYNPQEDSMEEWNRKLRSNIDLLTELALKEISQESLNSSSQIRTSEEPALLTGLSKDELQALANVKLAPGEQEQLSSLLAKQNEGKLSQGEVAQLDELIAQVDQLTLVKAKAMYTLHQLAEK